MALMTFREPNQARWQGVRPGHRGTQVTKSGEASNATVVVYTVTAGKVFYLTHYTASAFLSVNGDCVFFVTNAIDVVKYDLTKLTFRPLYGSPVVSGSFNPPLEIAAGWKIKVLSAAVNCYAHLFINGWEE